MLDTKNRKKFAVWAPSHIVFHWAAKKKKKKPQGNNVMACPIT